ncbi:hypothetical protein [Bacillus massilinigeriensis]|uniref:hypothetical protein n=1 Tax=Bacillus massilionigeriensis TaxID=1805475 RepID=UPI00156EBB4E|nr:hypothetical protein [Bacillus massilionigeriensis]
MSAILLIAGGLLPIYLQLTKQSLSVERELNATHILYEVILGNTPTMHQKETEVTRNRVKYEIIWKESDHTQMKEVCIYYKDGFHQSVKKCRGME